MSREQKRVLVNSIAFAKLKVESQRSHKSMSEIVGKGLELYFLQKEEIRKAKLQELEESEAS